MRKNLIDWYLSRESLPYWYVLLFDSLVVYVSGVAAYAINNGLPTCYYNLGPLLVALLVYQLFFLLGFRIFHIYSGIIRHSSFADLARVVLALMVGVAGIMLVRIWGSDVWLLPIRLRELLLQSLLATVTMCGGRVMVKMFYDFYLKHNALGNTYGLSDPELLDMEMKDLLPRKPIHVRMDLIRREICGKRIMVTGAAGSIGSELVRILANCKPEELILVDQAETPLHDVRMEMAQHWPKLKCLTLVTSICHFHRMEKVFRQYRPQIIFHAAAYKHVPMMEDNPVESILNNVVGTRNLADLAVTYHAEKFIMVSTDKAVNPTNVMGCSKRICEIYCQSLAKKLASQQATDGQPVCQFITTRFGNVLGSNGSVIPIFRRQIRNGGPVLVTHPDITRFFMLIPEACQLVLEASTIGRGGEILVFDMGSPVRIADLAQRMIDLSGRKGVKIKYVGLRDGEKLYEEVLNDEEQVLPTPHPQIKVAKVREYDYDDVARQIDTLVQTAITYDPIETVRVMMRIVPEYHSENETYKYIH